jgi:hypothetical protein
MIYIYNLNINICIYYLVHILFRMASTHSPCLNLVYPENITNIQSSNTDSITHNIHDDFPYLPRSLSDLNIGYTVDTKQHTVQHDLKYAFRHLESESQTTFSRAMQSYSWIKDTFYQSYQYLKSKIVTEESIIETFSNTTNAICPFHILSSCTHTSCPNVHLCKSFFLYNECSNVNCPNTHDRRYITDYMQLMYYKSHA